MKNSRRCSKCGGSTSSVYRTAAVAAPAGTIFILPTLKNFGKIPVIRYAAAAAM